MVGMQQGFTASEWSRLSKAKRVARCREFAADAERHAAHSDSEIMRRHFEKLAEQWHTLAAEIELERLN